jgi:hypothetical protein
LRDFAGGAVVIAGFSFTDLKGVRQRSSPIYSGGADPAASWRYRWGRVYEIKADSNSCKRA